MGLKITVLMIFMLVLCNSAISQISRGITLDAQDTDIRGLLSSLAKANGINLILGDSVKGLVTMSLRDVTPMDAIKLILNANGFVMEEVGNTFIAGKPEEVVEYLDKKSKMINLKYALASDLEKILNGIAAGKAEVQADSRTNSIIITGPEPVIEELEQFISLMDKELPEEFQEPKVTKVFMLKNNKASSLQRIISGLISSQGQVGTDDTTNTLVITDISANVERLTAIVEQLDVETPYMAAERARKEEEARREAETAMLPPPPEPELETRVFNLNHVEANAIKDILQMVLSSRGTINTFLKQKEGLASIQLCASASRGESSGGGQSIGSTTTQLEKEKWSDTLIITDEVSVLDEIAELIKKLDVRTPQVKIEAKLVETSLENMMNLGIEWEALHSSSDSSLKSSFPVSTTDGLNLSLGKFTANELEDIMVSLKALETRGKAKVMFSPSVMTLDNEMSQMLAVERIPVLRTFETEFRSTTGVEYIDVGISLSVIPHVTEDGYIIMDVLPQVDSIKEWTSGQNPAPVISSRVAHTRLRVKDGETFVIGGLMKDEKLDKKSGLPFLARIPLLGRLFGSKRADNSKTDLTVFITPTVYKEE